MIEPITLPSKSDSLVNQSGSIGMPQNVFQAIKTAAAHTGVDFSYLLNKASQESSFNPNAKAATSSATGLYQFTSQTWLSMIKNHGAQYGLGNYADQITTRADGSLQVSNPTVKQTILNLRKDPQISAEMAGEFDKENLASLKENVGGKIGGTELYLAHFLGAGGAADFLKKMKLNPHASAAEVLPSAAAANPSVFYTDKGAPRSLNDIYRKYAQKFDGTASTTMVASATPPAPAGSAKAEMPIWANAYVTADNTTSMTASDAMTTIQGAKKDSTPTSAMFATMVLAQAQLSNSSLAANLMMAPRHTEDQDKKKDGQFEANSYNSSIG